MLRCRGRREQSLPDLRHVELTLALLGLRQFLKSELMKVDSIIKYVSIDIDYELYSSFANLEYN